MHPLVPWAQSLGVALLGFAGAAAGVWLSNKKWWLIGLVPAAVLLVTIGAAKWFPQLEIQRPFSLLMGGRIAYALFAPLLAMVLVTPTMRLKKKRLRYLSSAFLGFVCVQYSLLPFLMPALVWSHVASLRTEIDRDGVCLQTTPYTCGPASSVTALRKIGIDAKESELGLAMYTSPALGTPGDVVSDVLQNRYASQGLRCSYRHFDSVDEMRGTLPVVAIVRYGFMCDHYVAVLEVSDAAVTVGDPLIGKVRYSRHDFEQKWRAMGVALRRST